MEGEGVYYESYAHACAEGWQSAPVSRPGAPLRPRVRGRLGRCVRGPEAAKVTPTRARKADKTPYNQDGILFEELED